MIPGEVDPPQGRRRRGAWRPRAGGRDPSLYRPPAEAIRATLARLVACACGWSGPIREAAPELRCPECSGDVAGLM